MELRSPLTLLLLLAVGLSFSPLSVPSDVVRAVALVLLSLVAFEGIARVKLHALDSSALRMLRWVLVFAAFKLLAFTLIGKYLGLEWVEALLLATVLLSISGKDPFLAEEKVWTTPLAMLLPFVVLGFADPTVAPSFLDQFTWLALKLIVSIGVGIFLGVLMISLLRKVRVTWHPEVLVLGSIATFLLSQHLEGYGLLAVAALGLFVGNASLKKSLTLEGPVLDIVAAVGVVLLGLSTSIPLTRDFFILAGALLAASLVLRYVALLIGGVRKEMWPVLLAPRGIPMAAVLLGILGDTLVSPVLIALGVVLLITYNLLALVGKTL